MNRPDLGHFPGAELVVAGFADLDRGAVTLPALLVSIGRSRLRRLGFDVSRALPDPERRLYQMLAESDANSAHGRYNALVRRLVSFERAMECAK